MVVRVIGGRPRYTVCVRCSSVIELEATFFDITFIIVLMLLVLLKQGRVFTRNKLFIYVQMSRLRE